MSVQELRQAHRLAAADGYIAMWEVPGIRRAALLHDNTVDSEEKAYLQDVLKVGFQADPGVLGEIRRLAFFGETPMAAEMTELHRRKLQERWFDDEYRQQAEAAILASTDTVAARMAAVYQLAGEVHLFHADVRDLGRKVLLSSADPVSARLDALNHLAGEANLFDSERKELGMAIIRTAYDRPEDRRAAVARLDRMVDLWRDERDALNDWIDRDDQSLEG